MPYRYRVSVLLALALCATTAQAATSGEKMHECLDLSGTQKVTSQGSQFVLVADGDAHYRLEVDSSCDALQMATRLEVSSDGQAGRLCPTGTRVKAKSGDCKITSVDRIDPTTYARYRRRR